jgi:cation transport protein ChaC
LRPDSFRHLPHLQGKMIYPNESQVRVTPERLAHWDSRARASGAGADWRLSDHQLENSRRQMLETWEAGKDVWVFGYGSLVWDPGFHFEEVRLAEVDGYQRRFSIKLSGARGSPERPALMLGLERGGRCQGLAFCMARELLTEETSVLWGREMLQGHYVPLQHRASTPQGPIDVLLFTSNTKHAGYVGDLPIATAAAIMARGQGFLGTNRQYLMELISRFEGLEIDDPYLKELMVLVDAIETT